MKTSKASLGLSPSSASWAFQVSFQVEVECLEVLSVCGVFCELSKQGSYEVVFVEWFFFCSSVSFAQSFGLSSEGVFPSSFFTVLGVSSESGSSGNSLSSISS
eukprot:g42126.t1